MGLIFVLSALTVAKVRHERSRADMETARRERAHRFAVQSLTSLMEARDSATGRHARRTQGYARLLAAHLAALPRFRHDLTPERVQLIGQLSPLHDIGKVGVRDAILNKPGALSVEELDEMRRHPGFGHETIANAERLAGGEGREAIVQLAKDIVYTHHERWDGHGYPRGLKGDEIPVAGRIVAVVDVYDALSNSRSYRASLTHEEAVATIAAGRGTHFDPDVVDAFLAVAEEFRQLSLTFHDEAAHP
jgi:putative two-component system response regulator